MFRRCAGKASGSLRLTARGLSTLRSFTPQQESDFAEATAFVEALIRQARLTDMENPRDDNVHSAAARSGAAEPSRPSRSSTYTRFVFFSDTHDGNPIHSEPLRHLLPPCRVTLLPCCKRSRYDNHPRLSVLADALDQSFEIRAQIAVGKEQSVEADAAYRVLSPTSV